MISGDSIIVFVQVKKSNGVWRSPWLGYALTSFPLSCNQNFRYDDSSFANGASLALIYSSHTGSRNSENGGMVKAFLRVATRTSVSQLFPTLSSSDIIAL